MTKRKNRFGLLAFLHWNHEWNQHHFPESLLPKAVQQIKELGIGTLRMDILWSDVQTKDGKLDFSRYDRLMNLVKDHDLEILAQLQYNKERVDKNGKEIWSNPPDSFDEFSDYVGKTVTHFKDRIHHWEIWNEPNLPVYWSGKSDQLKTYSDLLKKSYRAAKKADPTCVVLNGGLTAPLLEDVSNLYKQGTREFFDILNIHTFYDPHDSKSLSEWGGVLSGIEKIMSQNGDQNKKIWITEMGCPGIPEKKEKKKWFAGEPVTEKQQSAWLEKMYSHITKYPSVEKLFWAFYRDTPNEFKDSTDFLGLVREDLSPKEAYFRLKETISS